MLTAPQVARMLGVSLPAAHHALDAAGVPRTGRGHTRTASTHLVESMIDRRGAVPRSDRSGPELRVLAALSRSPLGQPSARAVAAKAGVSPTTASKVLGKLEGERLVARRESIVASGRARHERRWFANSRAWPEGLRDSVRRTRLPERHVTLSPLPSDLHHLFWNADPSSLDPKVDGSYIAGRLLQAPDLRAWQWALTNLSRSDVTQALARRGVDEETRALARNWWTHDG